MKFIVKESQIDSFLETHNQYKKYSEGLNIIFGENEIGKSTLMNFIKGILTKESDAKGYIKCEQDGKEFELRAEKKSKENNQYLDKINSHNFKEGFIITLDDIVYSSKKDAQTLVDKIKDSSSEGIKEREKELYGEIDCYIKMKTKNASNKLTPFFDEISKLEDDIRNTQQTEGLYNDICLELENLSKKIENLKKKQTCAELILDKEKLLEDISNISVNKILMNNKEKFYKLKENHSILKNKKMLCENDINILGKLKNDYETIKKSLDKIEYFEENDIHSFELNKDNLKEAKNITDTLNELVKDEDRIQKDIQNLRDNLKENETEKILLKEQIEELGIKNLKEYEEDKITLESYKMTYGELREKARQNDILNSKDIYSSVITLIFVVIFAISLYYLVTYNSLKVFLSICTGASLVGGIIGVFNCFHNKKTKNKLNYTDELNNLVKLSIDLCNKYDFNIDKTDFLSQLGTQIHIMTEKISKADNINRYINNL